MMLLFSPCKRCPCPCSDAVLVKKHWLGSFSIVLPLVCVGSFRLRGTADTRAARGVGGREGGDTMGGSGGAGGGAWPENVYLVVTHCGPTLPPPPSSCGMECGFPLPPVGWLCGFWGFGSRLSF